MQLFSARIRDKRFQSLVRMWLDTGATLPKVSQEEGIYDRVTNWVADSMDGAVKHLLRDGQAAEYGYDAEMIHAQEADEEWRAHKRKEAMKRLGKEGLVLALTYSARARKLLSPVGLAVTGAAVISAAAYPMVSRAVRQYLNPDEDRLHGIVQGGALSPLLANLYLHEMDVAVTRAGFRLVRYADDFVITCRHETEAQQALDFVARKLAELRLRLHPQKTRIMRFEDGLEFLGYRFDQFQNTAMPISPQDTSPVVKVAQVIRDRAPAALADAQAKLTPLAKRAGQQLKDNANRLRALIERRKEGRSQ